MEKKKKKEEGKELPPKIKIFPSLWNNAACLEQAVTFFVQMIEAASPRMQLLAESS